MATFSDSIVISTTPEAVFGVVSHLDQMGQFSPENTGGTWIKGATGPAVGAHFRGTNSNGKKQWNTTVEVVKCDPPRTFAFEVTVGPLKIAQWSYDIEATDEGTRVTETWLDRRSALARMVSKTIEGDREGVNRASVRATLEALKSHLES